VELMVFLRPRIIRTSEDARAALADLDREAPEVKKYQDESVSNKVGKSSKKPY
jgi:type II secretory pathway component GspD/PulD (secretin)